MPGDVNINLPESSGKTIQEVYQDTLKPTASSLGQTIGLIPRTIRAKLLPLEKWVLNQEYELEKTKILLDQRLAKCQAEQIVSPDPYVAVPALQAISYSMDSEELRKMYANLLSKSMYEPTKNAVHPAFVEMIKQMSPNDAKLLKLIYEANHCPIINLIAKIDHYTETMKFHTGFTTLKRVPNLTQWTDIEYLDQLTSLDNIERLGLLKIDTDHVLTDDDLYLPVRNTQIYTILKEGLQKEFPDNTIDEIRGIIQKNQLGYSFYTICISDSLEQTQ